MDDEGEDEECCYTTALLKLHRLYDLLMSDHKPSRDTVQFLLDDLVTYQQKNPCRVDWSITRKIVRLLKNYRTTFAHCDFLLRRYYSTRLCQFTLMKQRRRCNKSVARSDYEQGERYCKMHRPTMQIIQLFLRESSLGSVEGLIETILQYF